MDFINAAVKDLSMDKIRNAAEDVLNQTLPKSELEKKVFEVLSHKNWGASSTILNELARDTYDYDKYSAITKIMWDAMDGRPAAWRQVFKSLTLLEHLLKNGSDRIVEDARSRGHKLRGLYNFNYYEGTTDRGVGVREKSKQIMEVLQDNERVREERTKARKLREKFGGGMGMSGVGSNGNKYEGFGNDSYSGGYGNNGGGGNGGGGGYGNSGIGSGYSKSEKGYSGRYSDETDSEPTSTSNSTPTFATAPKSELKTKPVKTKKVKKKKAVVAVSTPAPEVDLFSFDEAPASAPASSADDGFDAFQGANNDIQFDAFGNGNASNATQPQQTFDAFAGATLTSPPTSQQSSNQMQSPFMMQQQAPMMMQSNQAMMQQSVVNGGNVQANFGNFSSAPAPVPKQEDDFGDFSGVSTSTKSATPSTGPVDPMSKLISLDTLAPNKSNAPSKMYMPIPAPAPASNAFSMSTFSSSSNQSIAPLKKPSSNATDAFSGLDGLNKPATNLMAPVPVRKNGGNTVMMQNTGPSVVDTMGLNDQGMAGINNSAQSMGSMTSSKLSQQQQQMLYAQQMQQMQAQGIMNNQVNMMNNMGMMYTPQQQQQMMMMNSMPSAGMQMNMNPMMMNGGGMSNQAHMQMGVMGGQPNDQKNMLGGQLMGENGFR